VDTHGRCAESIQVYYPALYPAKLVESSAASELIRILNQVERSKNEAVLYGERLDARIKELNGFASKLDDRDKKQKEKTAKEDELAKKKKEEQTVCRRPRSPECRKLREKIKELEKEITELTASITELNEALKELVNPNVNDQKKIKKAVPQLEEQKTKLKTLVDSTELLSSRLNTPDADTKLTALAQLLRAEKLHSILNNAQTYTLRVAVNANGTTKIKKNLFVDAKVRHSAGANLVYQLFNRNGAVAQGDVMQCYIDYRSANDVYQIVSEALPVKCNSRPAPPPKNNKTTEAGK
jgi:DNA repair exonuclease SbcCD ATPase subunit